MYIVYCGMLDEALWYVDVAFVIVFYNRTRIAVGVGA
jgi:hypothetical protein